MVYVYPEHDARLAGVRRLVYAADTERLVASCEASRRIVMLDTSAFDALPIVGASEVLDAPPGAIAVDNFHIFALVGESLVKFSNAAIPVELASVARSDDNNAWLELIGTDFLIYADGVDVVVARRDTLATVSRVTSLVGRVRFGIYDVHAHAPTAYVFGERTGCIVFVVSPTGGTLMAVEEATLPDSGGVTGAEIGYGEMILATLTENVPFWYFSTPTSTPYLDCEVSVGRPVKNLSYVSDDNDGYDFVFSTTERMEHSNERFDLSPETFALYAAGRCFRAYENGRVSCDSIFQVIRVTFGDTETTGEVVTITPSTPPVPVGSPTSYDGFAAVEVLVNMRLATRPFAGDEITIVFVPQSGMSFPDDINNGSMVFTYSDFNTTQYKALLFDSVGEKTVEFYAVSGWSGERTYGSLTVSVTLAAPPTLTPISGMTTPTHNVSSNYSSDCTSYNSPEDVTYAWAQVSGAGTVVFTPQNVVSPANPFTVTAGVVFPSAGFYEISLTATQADGQSVTVSKQSILAL